MENCYRKQNLLGTYQFGYSRGLVTDSEGNIVFYKSVIIGGVGGVLGQFLASPLFMIKTHLQAQAVESIAVGHQHHHEGTWKALKKISKEYGVSFQEFGKYFVIIAI